jgi:hypothetical protein
MTRMQVQAMLGATAVIVAAMAVTGCSSEPQCAGVQEVDSAASAGKPSAHEALAALLDTNPRWLDRTGWQVTGHASKPDETVTYTARSDTVTVFRDAENDRWYVSSYRGCA